LAFFEDEGNATDNNARPRLFQCIGRRPNTMGAGRCTGSDKGPDLVDLVSGSCWIGRPEAETAPPPVRHPVPADRGNARTAAGALL